MKLWKEKRTWVKKNAAQKLTDIKETDVKKIGVVKHAAYGDLLLTRPFLITLRDHFPNASITFSVLSHYTRGVSEDLIDNLHIMPGRSERKNKLDTYKNIKLFGDHDLIFDLTASTISFYISKLNKAKIKIGFQHHSFHRFIYDIAVIRSQFQFEAETFLDQLHIVGIQSEYPLKFYRKDEQEIGNKDKIVIFPTASNKEKSWSTANFTKLIKKMLEEFKNDDIVLLSGINSWEIEIADEIAKNFSEADRFKLISGSTDLVPEIKNAKVLISNDTGIRHLAISYETPTVGIFFDAPPFRYLPRFGNHKAAFDSNGGEPSVDNVFDLTRQIINPNDLLNN